MHLFGNSVGARLLHFLFIQTQGKADIRTARGMQKVLFLLFGVRDETKEL
jgi:hypothetical protein